MRSPDLQTKMLPGRTGKAQVRLAAAGRLRSAVALELAAGKVWALPIAVQPARGTRCSKGTGHPEWVRCHGPRAGAESHHACGREELLRCWADSETRLQGAGVPSIPSLLKTERRGRGLDSVARDNLADSLMAQGPSQRCLPYPNPTRPSQSVMGGRPLHRAGRQPVIAESTPSPGGMLNHPRDTALERLSVWIRNTGGSPESRGPRQPLLRFGTGGRRLGWEPLGRGPLGTATPMGLQADPVDLPAGRPPATPGTAGPPRVRDVRPSRGTPASHMRALGMASSSSLPIGSYDSH